MTGLVYRTAGAWGAGKGANLTAAEVDENFYDLDTRLQAVEENPAQPVQIDSITSSGSAITITMDDATVYGPFPIPSTVASFKGDWDPLTAYENNDIVLWGTEVYFVAVSHTSAAEFDANRTISGVQVYRLMIDIYDVALNASGEALTGGTHSGISFFIDTDGTVDATVNFSAGAEEYRDVISSMITGSDNVGVIVALNDAANTLSFSLDQAMVAEIAQDAVSTLLSTGAHSGISFSYDDSAGSLSATVTIGFLGLAETPNSYSGEALKLVRVKNDETGLEFVSKNDVVASASVPRFMGAMVYLSGSTSAQNYSAGTAIAFAAESYDTDGFHDNAVNNSRLTIPSGLGITKVRLSATVRVSSITAGSDNLLAIRKAGSEAFVGNAALHHENSAATATTISVTSGVMSVVDGDWFDLWFQTSDTSTGLEADRTSFSIEVVEVEGSINIANVATESTTSRTLGMADINDHLLCTNASPVTITVPANATVAIPVGATLDIEQNGTGQVTVSGAGGVTINKPSDKTAATRAQYSVLRLRKVATNTWTLSGDMA